MKHWEVVGYASDGAIYCPTHAPESSPETEDGKPSPLFAGDEGWESDVCDTCHWPLDDSRDVHGLWDGTARVALCIRCGLLPRLPEDHDTFPILGGWNGPGECGACGSAILPEVESDESDED